MSLAGSTPRWGQMQMHACTHTYKHACIAHTHTHTHTYIHTHTHSQVYYGGLLQAQFRGLNYGCLCWPHGHVCSPLSTTLYLGVVVHVDSNNQILSMWLSINCGCKSSCQLHSLSIRAVSCQLHFCFVVPGRCSTFDLLSMPQAFGFPVVQVH